MNPALKPILTELRQKLEALYGERLDKLVLFGSQARGDAEPDSDIDVLVVLKGEVRVGQEILRTSEIRSELCLEHSTVFSLIYISPQKYREPTEPLVKVVRREGVLL